MARRLLGSRCCWAQLGFGPGLTTAPASPTPGRGGRRRRRTGASWRTCRTRRTCSPRSLGRPSCRRQRACRPTHCAASWPGGCGAGARLHSGRARGAPRAGGRERASAACALCGRDGPRAARMPGVPTRGVSRSRALPRTCWRAGLHCRCCRRTFAKRSQPLCTCFWLRHARAPRSMPYAPAARGVVRPPPARARVARRAEDAGGRGGDPAGAAAGGRGRAAGVRGAGRGRGGGAAGAAAPGDPAPAPSSLVAAAGDAVLQAHAAKHARGRPCVGVRAELALSSTSVSVCLCGVARGGEAAPRAGGLCVVAGDAGAGRARGRVARRVRGAARVWGPALRAAVRGAAAAGRAGAARADRGRAQGAAAEGAPVASAWRAVCSHPPPGVTYGLLFCAARAKPCWSCDTKRTLHSRCGQGRAVLPWTCIVAEFARRSWV